MTIATDILSALGNRKIISLSIDEGPQISWADAAEEMDYHPIRDFPKLEIWTEDTLVQSDAFGDLVASPRSPGRGLSGYIGCLKRHPDHSFIGWRENQDVTRVAPVFATSVYWCTEYGDLDVSSLVGKPDYARFAERNPTFDGNELNGHPVEGIELPRFAENTPGWDACDGTKGTRDLTKYGDFIVMPRRP